MKTSLGLALALAIAPFAAAAGELSYSYLEGGYAQLNSELPSVVLGDLPPLRLQAEDVEAGGFFINGSRALGESLQVLAGYKSGRDDTRLSNGAFSLEADVELRQLHLGLGYRHGLSERADLIAEASYLHTDVEIDGTDVGGDDARIAVGVRGLLAPQVEGWLKGHYSDGDVYDGAFSATLGGQYRFNRLWGVTLEAEFGGDSSVVTLGARASF